MSLRGRIEICGLSHTGRVRDHNEDAIGSDIDLGIVVLADGMGGLNAGEVASGMSVELVMTELRSQLPDVTVRASDVDTGFSGESMLMGRAVRNANATVHHVSQTQPQCAGMGTTLVAAVFYDDRMTVAHVGDSRLYRMRGGELTQITADHSLVQELVDRGFYTRDEARNAANKNIVTRAVGIGPEVEVDMQEEVTETGDLFLLCSDGLSDMIDDELIRTICLQNTDNLELTAQALVDAANEHGGRDNISVILVRILRPYPARGGFWDRVSGWLD